MSSKNSTSQSLKSIASRQTRIVAAKISLAVSVLICLLWGTYIATDTNQFIKTKIESQRSNYSYWLKTGDTFQISRSLDQLLEQTPAIDGIKLEKDSVLVFSKSRNNLQQDLTNFQRAYNSTIDGASLRINYSLDLGFLVYLPLLLPLIFLAIVIFLNHQIVNLISMVVEPISQFSKKIDSSKSLAAIEELSPIDTGILEIQTLKSRLTSLATRLLEEEKRALQYREIETINKMSKQVAHDIRSPLSALSILASTKNAWDEDTKCLAKQSIERIQNIADDLLNESRGQKSVFRNHKGAETGPGNPLNSQDKVALAKTITESIKAFETSSNIKVNSILPPGSHTYLAQVDPTRLDRIISNLLKNSLEAAPDLHALKVSLEISEQPEIYEISIRDNGNGIPKHVLKNVGHEGFSTKGEKGNGLGVFGAKSYLESIGGSLSIYSEETIGSTFYLRIPR